MMFELLPAGPRRALLLTLILAPTLAACSTSGTVPSPSPQPRPRTTTPVRTVPVAPRVQAAPGLERVIGADRAALVAQFGEPRLDVWEGDARKLQFTGRPCVLDIYLYPPAPGREPEASFVDARRASDGQDVDRAACVAALRQR